MMLAPLGQKRIILADPDWGARLAHQELERSALEVSAFEDRCRRTFFGDLQSAVLYDRQGRKLLHPQTEGLTQEAIQHCRTIAKIVDRIAADFAEQGFEVRRIPYLAVSREIDESADEQDPNTVEPLVRYPEITYSNVLQEQTPQGPRVYLPQYGWAAFDKTAEDVWKQAGFQVIRIEGFTISAMYGGSLRCCTKILERSD
jgi:hypothetical protein